MAASRQKRFEAAQLKVSEAKQAFEDLLGELQEAFDAMSEKAQEGERGQAMQSAIDSMEAIVDQADQLESETVDFP